MYIYIYIYIYMYIWPFVGWFFMCSHMEKEN